MRLFAFAALLALPLLGFGAGSASADYYCCGKEHYPKPYAKVYYVPQDTAVFDCDAHHCETKIKLLAGSHIKAKCRYYGWCEVIGSVQSKGHYGKDGTSIRLANFWVPEYCLKSYGYGDEPYRGGEEYQGEGEGGYEGRD